MNHGLCAGIGMAAVLIAAPLWMTAQSRKPPVDQPAANRGQQLYATACSTCHGANARGTAQGPDLIRNTLVLTDRTQQLHGADFAAVLSRPPHAGAGYTAAQLDDLSEFLTLQVNNVLRGGAFTQPSDMLSGNPAAGKAFFYGAGGCSGCHSPTGDLAGVAGRMDPVALQQLWVFPQVAARFGFGRRGGPGAAPPATVTTVTVTPAAGPSVTGTLLHVDDFNVSLRDAAGQYHSFARGPRVKVVIHDPYAAHIALLDRLTDADIHNMTAYLETLK